MRPPLCWLNPTTSVPCTWLVRIFLTCGGREQGMITSKITSKAQTTIPQPVRAALRLKEGDEVAYIIEAGRVILTRAGSDNPDDPFATFSEWDSDADRKAYGR